MSGNRIDVVVVWDRLIGNTRTMAGLTGDPRMREHLREGEQARSAIAELIEAARWRDPIAEPAEHRQRVLVAYEAGRHVVVGAAVRWLHTPGDHDGEDEWEIFDSSYTVKVLAWRPMPEFDRAALARVTPELTKEPKS